MHRRGLWLLGLALLFLTSCSVDEGRSGGSPGDVVTGGGVTRYDIFSIEVRVSDAGDVTGYFRTRNTTQHSSFVIEGAVTCLNVVGNRASIGGVLERIGGDEFPDPSLYRGWFLYLEDNGGRGAPDRVGHQWLSKDPVARCLTPSADWWALEMTEGDIAVTEGPK